MIMYSQIVPVTKKKNEEEYKKKCWNSQAIFLFTCLSLISFQLVQLSMLITYSMLSIGTQMAAWALRWYFWLIYFYVIIYVLCGDDVISLASQGPPLRLIIMHVPYAANFYDTQRFSAHKKQIKETHQIK